MKIVAHEETRKILARANDPARPLPTVTFDIQDQNFEFKVGNQTLQLQYPGPNHEPGNIGIYHPNQKVLMLVDIIFPGWIMWRRFAVSQDIPGYFNVVKTLNSRWDYKVLIAGHVGRAGTHADVDNQLDFMTDLHKAAYEGLMTIKPGQTVNSKNGNNPWAIYRDYVDQVTNHCVNKVSPKWANRLAAFDVWIYDQCLAMEQSLRIACRFLFLLAKIGRSNEERALEHVPASTKKGGRSRFQCANCFSSKTYSSAAVATKEARREEAPAPLSIITVSLKLVVGVQRNNGLAKLVPRVAMPIAEVGLLDLSILTRHNQPVGGPRPRFVVAMATCMRR
jgi:hypothetical protein